MIKIKVKKISALIMSLMLTAFSLSACSKKADCKIKNTHVHKYIAFEDCGKVTTYLNSEKITVNNFNRQDSFIYINSDDIEFYKVKGELFDGIENWNYLFNVMAASKDYLSYYYEYEQDDLISISDADGNVSTIICPNTVSGWSNNPNYIENTGVFRVYHHRFIGYRIVRSNGKYILEKSPAVDDIREIIYDYPYFSIDPRELWYAEYKTSNSNLPQLEYYFLTLRPADTYPFKGPDLTTKELTIENENKELIKGINNGEN